MEQHIIFLLKFTSKLRPKGGVLMEHEKTWFILPHSLFQALISSAKDREEFLGIKEWEEGEGLWGSPPSVLTDGSVTSI